jgi:phage gpG-like protein
MIHLDTKLSATLSEWAARIARTADSPSLSQAAAEAIQTAQAQRIFTEGRRSDGSPLGTYASGPRQGQPITLRGSGALADSMTVRSTPQGAEIGFTDPDAAAKIAAIEARHGPVFAPTDAELAAAQAAVEAALEHEMREG